MKRVLTLVLALALCATSLGWIHDKPKGAQFVPENSPGDLERAQQHQGTYGEANAVEMDGRTFRAPAPSSDGSAADDVIAASRMVEPEGGTTSKGERKSGSRWWLLLVGGSGLGIVLAVRQWANKAIPEAPQVKRVRW